MKKIFTLLSIIILGFSIFNTSKTEASPGPTINIGSTTVQAGDNISIPISITNAVDVKSFIVRVIYDGDLLTYTGYTANYPTTGTTSFVEEAGGIGKKYIITWTPDSPLNGDIIPVTINFTVKSPRTVALPSAIQFGGAAGRFIYNSSNIDIKSSYTFTNGTITATPATLSSISISHPANKLSYYVGESLDIGGLEITGTYNDTSTKIETVTQSNVTGFNSTIAATGQVLTVTVGVKTTTYTIDIVNVPVTLSSVAITTPATKLSYYVGDSLSITGLVVTGTYSDTSTQTQTITVDNITGFNSTVAATGQILTVTVGTKTTTYTVDIKNKPTITIGSTTVFAGDNIIIPITISNVINIKRISFNFLYDGDLLIYTGYTSNYGTPAGTGTTTITTGVGGGTTLKVIPIWTSNDTVTGNLTPINLNFTVKSPMTVTLPSSITFGGASGNSIKNSASTELKTDFTFTNGSITATPVVLNSIAITHVANKLTYYVGDALETTGLEITGTYNDTSTKIETITSGNITGFNSGDTATGQVLTVTVGAKTTTYTVDIIRRQSSGGSGGGGGSYTPPVTSIIPKLINTPTTNPVLIPNSNIAKTPEKIIFKTTKTIKIGAKNEDVKSIQIYLNSLNYDCGIADGIFGKKTKTAIMAFQKANNLIPDGAVGPKTKEFFK